MKNIVVFFFLVLGNILHPFMIGISKVSATSDALLIYQVQTSGATSGTSAQEAVTIINRSIDDIRVDGICIQYSAGSNGTSFSSLKCIESVDKKYEVWLSSGGSYTIVTNEFLLANPLILYDEIFNAGIAASSGHIRIVANDGIEIDRVGWGSATMPEGTPALVPTAGSVIQRDLTFVSPDTDNNSIDFFTATYNGSISSGIYEKEVVVDLCPNIVDIQASIPEGFMQNNIGECVIDVCPNIDDLQIELPEEYEIINNECVERPKEDSIILITELLPNPLSYDTGIEYIELFNPNNFDVQLKGYVLELGPTYSKKFEFSEGILASNKYMYVSDEETNITLPNTSATLRLKSPAGTIVSESEEYAEPEENLSWSYIANKWVFTNQHTPGAINKSSVLDDKVVIPSKTNNTLSPCPAGKYRNPLTNRCRSVTNSTTQLKACSAGQVRNPQTNRCRNITSSTSNLKPCGIGQERNPQTNRCKKVLPVAAQNSAQILGVKDSFTPSSESQTNWYVLGFFVFAALGYIVFEWRNEIKRYFYTRKIR